MLYFKTIVEWLCFKKNSFVCYDNLLLLLVCNKCSESLYYNCNSKNFVMSCFLFCSKVVYLCMYSLNRAGNSCGELKIVKYNNLLCKNIF